MPRSQQANLQPPRRMAQEAGHQHLPPELLDLVLEHFVPESPKDCARLRLVSRLWRDTVNQFVVRVAPKSIGNHETLQGLVEELQTRHPTLHTLDLARCSSHRLITPAMPNAQQQQQMEHLVGSLVYPGRLMVAAGVRSLSRGHAETALLRMLRDSPAFEHIRGLTFVKDFRELQPQGIEAEDETVGVFLNTPLAVFGAQLQELTLQELELGTLSACTALTRLSSLTRLEFQGGVLRQVPEQLTQLTSLSCLVFDNCHMKVRTAFKMANMPRVLTHLTATHSHIALNIHPKDLAAHTRLVHLDLSHNKIGALPATLGLLTSLQVLNVSHNSLVSLPNNLSKLCSLEELYTSHNKIKQLPRNVKALFWLQTLDISYNALMELPEDVHKLVYLQYFDVRGNPLRTPLPQHLQAWLSTSALDKCLYDPHVAPPRLA